MTGDSGPRTRVLLVDDHPLVRTAVRQAISAADIEVVAEAGTAGEAMRLARDSRPDLVLLDIDLPGMSGLELLGELTRELPGTQVVMLTVSGAHRDLVEALRLGAVGYLTKDVTPDALIEAVRAARAGELPMPPRLAASAIAEVARSRGSPLAARGLARLTDRELEVLGRIAEGETDREAAAGLGISTRTVEAHVGNILRKLEVPNRAEAARTYRAERAHRPTATTG
ncbi:MAG TPA: response regulator transcription factor [Candidatus Limnocylindrales bacterium]|nr:response regulator transcription factor [Candidatus Limnocylindrales bacterium]